MNLLAHRAVGSHVVMDPALICKKTRRLRGRLADICKKEPALLKEISKGVSLGTKECQYQFRNRRWNCTTVRRSLKKVLMRGECFRVTLINVFKWHVSFTAGKISIRIKIRIMFICLFSLRWVLIVSKVSLIGMCEYRFFMSNETIFFNGWTVKPEKNSN